MPQHVSAPPPRLANKPRRRRPLISLTPLIDVVFILLVFFMLASSFLNWRTIDLNTPARAAAHSSVEGAMLIEVRTGGVRLSGQRLTLDELAGRVTERLRENPEQKVLVKPAPGVSLQGAVDVLDRLNAAGVSRLSLIRDGGAGR